MEAGILISYFARQSEARGALRQLARKGFRRAALVYKTADGDVHTRDPFLWRRALGVTLATILFGSVAGVVSLVLPWPESILSGTLSTLTSILAGGLLGALFSVVWIRRPKYGVDRRLLEDHARWLVSEESVLILQAPMGALRLPVAVLRESSEVPPAIFVLHPKRESLIGDVRSAGVPLSLTEIRDHAERLAGDHEIDPEPQHSTELLERLEQARRWIHQVCSDLSEANRLEQGTTAAAEWILDNEYIIEGNVHDVQLNLPRRYYRQLPEIANEPYRGLPRIYGLAKELISHSDLRLDRENILAFLEAYQS
ncbi:MAG: glycosyl transferase, partial [Bacteroidetes bacterium]|nr:glycosyl transferase [Bacteroidota bacterium]